MKNKNHKKSLLVITISLILLSFSLTSPVLEAKAEKVLDECKWATRETWQGWEAICIETGVGYVCECGDVKPYY